jgi:hypothetical protein
MEEYLQQFPNLSAEEYRALLNAISDDSLTFIRKAMEQVMPDEHVSVSTLHAVILHIAVKAICSVCENNQKARESSLAFFCDSLPEMVKKVVFLHNSSLNKNKH